MFGNLRALLAMMVLVGHLTDKWWIGTYAVFAFYIISGYLMTLIMHESYGYSAGGRWRFAVNRLLRLYPMYWVAALLSAVIILQVGESSAKAMNKVMVLPDTLPEYAQVFSMLFIGWLPDRVAPNLLPTTWALTVELFFYALICLGLSRSRRVVQCWLLASVAYVVYAHWANLDWPHKYYPVAAASLPFSLGAMIYFLKRDGWPTIGDGFLSSPLVLCAALLAISTLAFFDMRWFQTGFYFSLSISLLLVYQLAMGRDWGEMINRFDGRLGDYSYPVYLLHWPVALATSVWLFGKPVNDVTSEGLLNLVVATAGVLVVSFLLLRFVDRPVQRLRARLKSAV